jgi:hypothetical protein
VRREVREGEKRGERETKRQREGSMGSREEG